MSHSWRSRGCYGWRVRKPHAPLGLPVIGRRWGYVGQSSSRYHRDRQHLHGDSGYGAPGASWSDLEPKAYSLPCLFHGWRWARLAQEQLWIWLLCPAYNVQGQAPWNLRKISKARAQAQRWARDERRREAPRRRMLVDFLVTSVRLVTGLLIMAGLAYGAWEVWAR